MPSAPGPGEGMLRTFELLEELHADVGTAYAMLEGDRASQYLRRCVVRAVFSYIEAVLEALKEELRSAIRTRLYTGQLTDKDIETLGSLNFGGYGAPGKFLPLDVNAKRTFRLATKIWGLNEFKLTTDGEDFKDFLTAKGARNKLTHPRRYYDIQVTDYDMHCHSVACEWVHSEFQRLLNEKLRTLVSEEERLAIRRSHIEFKERRASGESA